MRLTDVARQLGVPYTGSTDPVIKEISHDSRRCLPGSLFAAIAGERFDGHQFIDQALERGAVAVMSERPRPSGFAHPWLRVDDVRLALALAAAAIFGHPSRHLTLIGVTGTNGKTTTATLVEAILRAAGFRSASMGTIHYRLGETEMPAERTTPEAPDIQRFLARACAQGITHVVMEVSSHALDLKRVDGTEFAIAVFTNLTPEHLDYHRTMDAYFAAKRRLFEGATAPPPRGVVINADDPRADELLTLALERSSRALTYGFHAHADVRAQYFAASLDGLTFVAHTPIGDLPITSPLVGKPHVYNILAAIAVGLLLDMDAEPIVAGIQHCPPVAGRFEVVDEGQDFAVVVDYAHTHDALQNAIETARVLTPYRIITLFGCGGDRDLSKRAPMGEVAARLSDLVIATSDNPRSEDPQAIISQIEVGLRKGGAPYLKIPDRKQAIWRAIQEARPGDLVLIAGKGHETYQILKDGVVPFDDREVARAAIRARMAGSRSLSLDPEGGPSTEAASRSTLKEVELNV